MAKDSNMLNISLWILYQENISSRFPSNSEVNGSELLENLEEMFPRYWYQMVDHEQTMEYGICQ